MALYFIGDVQGCHAAFERLLSAIDFSPSRDTLYLLGDLVNRGPESLSMLRKLLALGDAAQCLLGNHDLHLLALTQGIGHLHRLDTIQNVLGAPDIDAFIDWLRHRPLVIYKHGWLMVHAGVLPQWSIAQVIALAGEVEQALRGSDARVFLQNLYGNVPNQWHNELQGTDRLRVVVNALTRLRFCTPEGEMEFSSNKGADVAPTGYCPWFSVPGRISATTPIAFGHWSALTSDALGAGVMRHNALPMDTGCVWGGCLTAARLGDVPGVFDITQISCSDQSTAFGKI